MLTLQAKAGVFKTRTKMIRSKMWWGIESRSTPQHRVLQVAMVQDWTAGSKLLSSVFALCVLFVLMLTSSTVKVFIVVIVPLVVASTNVK